jgi:hypothetical protein
MTALVRPKWKPKRSMNTWTHKDKTGGVGTSKTHRKDCYPIEQKTHKRNSFHPSISILSESISYSIWELETSADCVIHSARLPCLNFQEEIVTSEVSTLAILSFSYFLLDTIMIALLQNLHWCSEEPQLLHSLHSARACYNDSRLPFRASPLSVLTSLGPFFFIWGFLDSESFSKYFFSWFP